MRNKAIVRKMAMPNEMFPVASMLVSLYHVVPQLVILMIACLAYGWTPDLGGLAAVLLALAIIMVLGTALALLFSAANVFFRDWSSFVNILTNFVRFSVPMIYPYSMVDERFGQRAPYYLFNPIADAVLLFQRAFWVGTTEDPERAGADRPARPPVHPRASWCSRPACCSCCCPRWSSAGSRARSRSGSDDDRDHPRRERDEGVHAPLPPHVQAGDGRA